MQVDFFKKKGDIVKTFDTYPIEIDFESISAGIGMSYDMRPKFFQDPNVMTPILTARIAALMGRPVEAGPGGSRFIRGADGKVNVVRAAYRNMVAFSTSSSRVGAAGGHKSGRETLEPDVFFVYFPARIYPVQPHVFRVLSEDVAALSAVGVVNRKGDCPLGRIAVHD